MRKTTAVGLLVVLVLLLIVSPAFAEGTAEGEGPEDVTELTMWHMYTDRTNPAHMAYFNALDETLAEMPNVVVEEDGAATNPYKTRLRTAIAADAAPDIFYAWSGAWARPFVDANALLNLDPYLDEKTLSELKPGVLDGMTYDGSVYGLPFKYDAILMFYNRRIFQENNLEIPTTIEELIQAGQTLRANGISPLAVGAKNRNPMSWFLEGLAIRHAGVEETWRMLRGESSIDQEPFLNAVKDLARVSRAGVFADNVLNLRNPEVNAEFMAEQVAMVYNGTWSIGQFEDQENSAVAGHFVAARMPEVSGGLNSPDEFQGGCIDSFMISNNTENPELVVELVQKLARSFSRNMYQIGSAVSPWRLAEGEVDPSLIPEILLAVQNEIMEGSRCVPQWRYTFEPEASERCLDLAVEVYAEKVSPESYIGEMQKVLE